MHIHSLGRPANSKMMHRGMLFYMSSMRFGIDISQSIEFHLSLASFGHNLTRLGTFMGKILPQELFKLPSLIRILTQCHSELVHSSVYIKTPMNM